MSFFNIGDRSSKTLSEKLVSFSISLENMNKSLESLYAAQPLHNFPEQLVALIYKHFNPYLCRYYEYVKDTHEFKIDLVLPKDYTSPKKVRIISRNISDGAIGQAYQLKDIVIINSARDSEKNGVFINIDDKIKSEVIIPILFLNDIVGIIIIDFNQKIVNSERNIFLILGKLFRYFTQNYFENINREKRLQFISNLTEKMDVGCDETIDHFFNLINEVFGIKFLCLWLNTEIESDDVLILKSLYPLKVDNRTVSLTDFDNQIIRISDSFDKEVFESQQPHIYCNLNKLENFPHKKFFNKFSIEWFISYPIFSDGKFIGIIYYTPFETYGEVEKTELAHNNLKINEIGSYFKLFEIIHKSWNLDNIQNFLKEYDQIFSNLMTFEDERNSWNSMAELVKTIMNSDGCSVFLKDNNSELVLYGTTGIIGNHEYSTVRYKLGEGLTGYVFQKCKSFIYYDDYNVEFEKIHANKFSEIIGNKKSKSIIFVPLKSEKGEVIGLVRCNNKANRIGFQFDRFTNDDIIKLENISKVVSNVTLKVKLVKNILEDRERNIYSLRHEILSPVEGIRNHSEWFKHHLKNNKPENWNVGKIGIKFDDIEQNIKLIEVLVYSMDNLDKIVTINQQFNFLELVRKCEYFFKHEFERHNIIFTLPHYLDVPSKFNGDQLHLMRVFYNLIRNSIKYKDDNEPLNYIKISAVDKSDKIQFILEDNGIGIKSGEENIIFNKFTRGSDATKFFPEGTGIGLAYCKNIIEKHRGKIFIEKLRKPTRIYFELPKKLI